MNKGTKVFCFSLLILCTFLLYPAVSQTTYTFSTPAGDQWQYPFNGTVGSREVGSLFLNAATSTFDLRDAMVLVQWDTSGQIPPGQPASWYDVDSISLEVWNTANAVWPTTTAVELYGVGYGEIYDASTWQELSPVVAGAPPSADPDRDPYPITLTGYRAENLWTPQPWVLGTFSSYTPGSQSVPFAINFAPDMSNPTIRAYIQQGLQAGQLTFALSTDHLTAGMGELVDERPNLILKEGVGANPGSSAPQLQVTLHPPSTEAVYFLSEPSDDQWQYPFNSTVGARANAPLFLTPTSLGFDRRDGMMLVRWDTSSIITPGQATAAYDPGQVVLRLWNRAQAVWGATSTVQIQLFGVDYGPTYTEAGWSESSAVVATVPGPPGPARDPYPIDLSGVRAENNDQALPWAVGAPYQYDPHNQQMPFAIDFDLNLGNATILNYVKEGLNQGRLTFAVSTNQESFFGAPAGFDPYLVTKEGVSANPGSASPQLAIRLGTPQADLETLTFDTPAADRWWYPFNGTPGSRDRGGLFYQNEPPFAGVFNYRDGANIVKWNTSDSIAPGLSPTDYDIRACRVTVWNTPTASWVLSGTNSTGLPNQIELFGVGFGPTYTASSWTETSAFIGGNVGTPGADRDPYPIHLLTGGHAEDVTDELNIHWALGTPQGYVPEQMTEAFPVTFDVDVTNPTIRDYLQNGLASGNLFWYLTCTIDASMSSVPGPFPDMVMKEGLSTYPGAEAAKIELIGDFPLRTFSEGWENYR